MEQFSEEENKKKYQRDGKDLIDEWSEISYKIAVIACITKVQGYFRRYNSSAQKAKNETDILKSMDYLQRAKLAMYESHPNYRHLLQLEYAIKDRKFSSIDNLCSQILLTILI